MRYGDNKDKRKRGSYGRKPKNNPESEMEFKPQKDAEPQEREYEINPSFQKKAFKDLAFGAITVPVDPLGEVSYQADPYAILEKTNKVVDAVYPGTDNTSGSIVPQLSQGSDSTFANVPDSLEQEIKINIYYCKTNANSNADVDSDGKGTVNNKMAVPYDDILNTITSEAFYDLKFFDWVVDDQSTTYSADGMLDVLLNYQSVVQTLANVPLRYKVIRSLEKTLKDMSYYNGSGRLNRLYGLLKKSSFVTAVKSVSETLMNHFLDEHWFKQVSMLVAIPCRKANDMLDPLIDIIPTYDINETLKVKPTESATKYVIDMSKFHDLMYAARDFMLYTSPQALLSMVRSTNYSTAMANAWINRLTDDLDTIVAWADEFRTQFADLLVAFKRMSKVGITDWKTGWFMPIDHIDEEYEPKFNKLIYDIIRSSYTGSRYYKYIDRTGQWECHDTWDRYLGISSYSYKSGGCVLLTSTRNIDKTDAPASVAVPVLFYGTDYTKPVATILTRQGDKFTLEGIRTTVMNSGPISKVMGRLLSISPLDDEHFIMPVVDITSLAGDYKSQAWVANLLNELFPYSAVEVETQVYNYQTSPDALCFVDVEVQDQTNAVETFVRQHSPFRVVKTTLDAVLGFKTK